MIRQVPRPIYSFPELKTQEILQCMVDLNILLTENELLKPTSIIVQRVYEAFTEIFMGISKEHYISNENSLVTSSLEYPEIYLDALSLIRFYKIIVRLLNQTGIDDFGIKDLIRPEAPRFKIILSAVINFAKFREEQLSIYEDLNRKSEDIQNKKENVYLKYQDLSNRYSLWKKQRAEEEPEVQRIREINNHMIQELRDLKREQSNLTTLIDGLKVKRSEYSEKLVFTH